MSSSPLTAHTNKIEVKPIQRSRYLGSRFKKIEDLMELSEQDGNKAIPELTNFNHYWSEASEGQWLAHSHDDAVVWTQVEMNNWPNLRCYQEKIHCLVPGRWRYYFSILAAKRRVEALALVQRPDVSPQVHYIPDCSECLWCYLSTYFLVFLWSVIGIHFSKCGSMKFFEFHSQEIRKLMYLMFYDVLSARRNVYSFAHVLIS